MRSLATHPTATAVSPQGMVYAGMGWNDSNMRYILIYFYIFRNSIISLLVPISRNSAKRRKRAQAKNPHFPASLIPASHLPYYY